jgi:hypothetical protein
MRIAVALAASVLVAGCSQGVGGQPERAQSAPQASSPTARTTTTPAAAPTKPPAPGAPMADVTAWIGAGTPAAPADFHTAQRDGERTALGDDIAFTTPSGKTRCMTYAALDAAMHCLVGFTDPPPPPPDVVGQWVGTWVDFPGPTLDVGSVHGDPGPFARGDGPELPYGQSLAFGDYRCRADPAALYCVNYAHQSAARISDAGVEPFGCLTKATPPPDIGIRFSCPP